MRRTWRRVSAQASAELRLSAERGESVLLTLLIPLGLLSFFSLVRVLPLPAGSRSAVSFLAPGILALAVMSTAMVSLGIATGFERQYGVLKRLGSTPLGRPALLAAKTSAVVAVEVVQAAAIVAVALALGWHPVGDPVAAVLAAALATAAFAGIGLAMAGRLRAEATLAAANGLYLVLLLVSGMVVPLSSLPGPMASAARVLPSGALSQILHANLASGGWGTPSSWVALAAWSVAAPALAATTFRWE